MEVSVLMTTIKKILFLLSDQEKKKLIFLLIMILVMSLLDILGIVSILPFVAVLSNPQLIETNQALSIIYNYGKFKNTQDFFFIIGLFVFIILCISLFFKTITTYLQLRFGLMREFTIGRRLLEGYLNQPYSWFLNQHSSDIGKNILSEVNKVISGCVLPMIELITQSTIAIVLIIFLLFIDPILSLSIAAVLGSSYAVIYKIVRGSLDRIGKDRLKANAKRFSAVIDAFGAVKEVKLGGLENVYLKKFSDSAIIFSRNQTLAEVIARIPRFVLEAIAFGGLIIIILYLLKSDANFTSIIPIISLYVFAGYRLLPSIQSIYSSLAQIRFSKPALDTLYNDIKNLKSEENKPLGKKIKFKDNIVLENIFFAYPKTTKNTLSNINIKISAKSIVGFVGATGSGKSSAVDLILGLLEPQKGSIRVDGQIINKNNLHSWQRSIGYVPQQIFLADDSIINNIAFGVSAKNINQSAVEKAAKISNLHNFIMDDLEFGYQTNIGERGVRLSGGQRQRIGIARALYHEPQVLIFDEATSALDKLTEKIIMEAVYNISQKITIIIIAHRLSTVKTCNKIYRFEKGRVMSPGTYEQLIKEDETFRKMFLE